MSPIMNISPPKYITYLLALFDNIAFKSLKFWMSELDHLSFIISDGLIKSEVKIKYLRIQNWIKHWEAGGTMLWISFWAISKF